MTIKLVITLVVANLAVFLVGLTLAVYGKDHWIFHAACWGGLAIAVSAQVVYAITERG